MGKFVVSARKYRPQKFSDVVGQQAVTATLKNAIVQDTLAHAFLFCGPRGVGKTTCARILAKVLNCQHVTKKTEPCGVCASCIAMENHASMNVIEVDAASHNSVEHIRTLNEQVRFQPQAGEYKVFIIDEVHMLSSAAFNAFLKTLEEPPPYAKFILATTEKHKIIPTILSRCQIFDFKRISVQDIAGKLGDIAEEENIQTEVEALHLIAEKADGALRDALSVFDRLKSYSDKNITFQDVTQVLNVLDYQWYFKVVDALLQQDINSVLNYFDQIRQNGFEGDTFINGLADHFRNLLVSQVDPDSGLIAASETLRQKYSDQAIATPKELILSALHLLNDCDVNYRMAANKRLHIEMALIKLVYVNRLVEGGNGKSEMLQEEKKRAGTKKFKKDSQKKNAGTVVETSSVKEKKTNASNQRQELLSTPQSESSNEFASTKVGTTALTERIEGENDSVEYTMTEVDTPNEEIEAIPEIDTSEKSDPFREEPETDTLSPMVDLSVFTKNGLYNTPSLDTVDEMVKKVEKETAEVRKHEDIVLKTESVEDYWNHYLEKTSSQTVRSVLKTTKIQVEEDKIVATVNSSIARTIIMQELALIDHLRTGLKKPRLRMEIIVEDVGEAEIEKPMSIKEKYEEMVSKNPHLLELQKTFSLRLVM